MKYLLTILFLSMKRYYILVIIAFRLFFLFLFHPYSYYKGILRRDWNETSTQRFNKHVLRDKSYDCDYLLFDKCLVNLNSSYPSLLLNVLLVLNLNRDLILIFRSLTPQTLATIIIRLYSTESCWIEIKFYSESLTFESIRKCMIEGLSKKYVNLNMILYFDLVLINRIIR